jgi:predicted GNAT superfamily acetyltransferase
MYGDSDSPLHQGVGTDRFVAVWKLDSTRVESRLVGRGAPQSLTQFAGLPRAFGVQGDPEFPVPAPAPPASAPDPAQFLVPIPARIQELKARDPAGAAAWRDATRAVFTRALENGYQVVELIRDGALSYYVVEQQKSAPAVVAAGQKSAEA